MIIQHLSPDYKSLMPEILLKRTSLPVHTAEDGMEVKPDNVYLIPRKMNMKIFHSRLHLTEKNNLQVLNLPIDIFFHSLAEDFEDKAIGVILSGTGSDGSRGIRVIRENGGIIIVQDPDSSKFDGMPKSAITTGTVDFILPPQEIPEKIMRYVKHPYIKDKDKNQELAKVPEDYLSKIILFIKETFGLDFTYYKDTTISRRIERRLSINQVENLKDYLDYLYSSKKEQKTLYNELLIGVTKFFRDSEAFLIVENEIIPSIFENKLPKDEVRVWVSACSTGEEAYSVAILFKEYMLQHSLENKIKIFATDVDKTAIEYASMGVYNASISADVSPERLNRFFIQAGDSFRINDEIREMIVFARHNVIKDPPFNKIDFLLCRNLLIYFQTALQQKVLSLFNFALNKTGYLFLGNSESIGDMEHFYETINIKWKIFKSKRSSKLPADILDEKFPGGLINPKFQMRKPVYALKSPVADLVNIFTEKIIEDIAPETVIVNENYEIINSFGDLNKFLIFPKTRRINEGFEYIITKMVPSNLKLTFSIAINKAIKSGNEVIHHQVKFQKSESDFIIADLKFIPLLKQELYEKYVLIYFYERDFSQIPGTEIKSFEDVDQQAQQRIFDLENELKHTKENLQASIEELETTNEELQSTNEELVSANEELQSTNEELQSVNEELYTVNTEFQAKNHDLLVMNNDMENLLQNSEVRIIFLDPELKIRKFTDNISDIFNLKKNDLERPLSDITHHVRDVDLVATARGIIQNNVPVKKTVKARDRWYHMKFLPYTTQKGYRDGVVISFIDVSDFLNSQKELRLSEGRFKKVIEAGFDAFYLLKPKRNEHGEIIDFILTDINKKAEEQMSMSREQLIGNGICELFPVNLNNGYLEIYKNVAKTGVPFEQEYHISGEFAAPGWFYQQVVPEEEGLMIFNRNISARKQMELDLQLTTDLYQALFKNMTKGFALHQIITDALGNPVDYRFVDVNEHFEEITGLKRDELLGRTILEVLPNIERIWIEKYGKVALTGEHLIFEQESKILKKTFRVNAYSPIHGQFATLFEEI